MTICTACNWTPHDASIHGRLCKNGHPVELVGFYTNGQRWPACRGCVREANRRYYWRYPERMRERNRANYMSRLARKPVDGRRIAGRARDALGVSLATKAGV